MFSGRKGFKTLIESYIISKRWYRSNKSSLYAKISPQGNPSTDLTPELDRWVDAGNKLRLAELQRISLDLRKRKRFSQALQVSEWTKSRGVHSITPVQHAVMLDLIGKVRGFSEAESYFSSLSEEKKTIKCTVLSPIATLETTGKALLLLKTIRDKGLPLSSMAFNDIMVLYTSTDRIEKVPEVFKKMREHGVQPDNLSYRICINTYRVRSNIEAMEKILNEMENDAEITPDWNTYAVVANFYAKARLEEKAKISLQQAEKRLALAGNKDALGYNHLISVHARLGSRDDVLRLWNEEKTAWKRCLIRDYINTMEALVRLDDVEEAEKVLKEWETSTNCYDYQVPKVVIVAYIDKGSCEKAEALLNHFAETTKEPTPNIWGMLGKGYLKKGNIENLIKSLQTAPSLHESRKELKLDSKVIKVVTLVGERGSCEDCERVVNLLRSVVQLERQSYHTLLESYTARGKSVNWIIDMMKADEYEEDEETIKILALQQTAAIFSFIVSSKNFYFFHLFFKKNINHISTKMYNSSRNNQL